MTCMQCVNNNNDYTIFLILGSLDMEAVFNVCDKLAFFFSLEKDSVLIKFCEKVGKYDAILKIAQHLYNGDSDSKNLCLAAVLLFKYMACSDTQLLCDSFNDVSDDCLLPSHSGSDSLFNLESTSSNFIMGLKLSEQIIIKALINAKENELYEVVEVMNWINSCFYLTRYQENPLQREIFKHRYHSEHTLPAYSTFAAIRNVFDVFCRFIGELLFV